VPALDFLKGSPGETIGRLNDAVKAVSGKLPPGKYHTLMTVDLTSYTSQILDVIDKLGLNGLLCPGEKLTGGHIDDAMTTGGFIIDIRKFLGCKKGKPEIDLGLVSSYSLPGSTRSVLGAAGEYGAYEVIGDILNKGDDASNVPMTDTFRGALVNSLVSNYEHKDDLDRSGKPAAAGSYVDTLYAIKPDWDTSADKSNLDSYNNTSADSRDLMKHDERTDVEAIMAEDISLGRRHVNELSREKYPHMQA
jgi:hypothetical protein